MEIVKVIIDNSIFRYVRDWNMPVGDWNLLLFPLCPCMPCTAGALASQLEQNLQANLYPLIFFTKYVRDMDTKMEELDSTRLGVENHLKWIESCNLEIPVEVTGWLEEVRKVNAQVEIIPSDLGGCFCFHLLDRMKFGSKAFKISNDIDRLMQEKSKINWTDHRIPFGNVDRINASTSTLSTQHNYFKSRDRTFIEALKALQPDNKSYMIALCGIDGVGKTTMMENLKRAVIEKKMFDFIFEATIGEKTDPIIIQQAIAEFLGVDLKERVKEARAYKLSKSFEAKSHGGKKKILVILDDVSQFVNLNDIGLSHLPNQGVNFKILLISPSRDVCTMMGVEVNSILNVEVITDLEAQSFFHQFVNISNDVDLDVHKIGDDIARRCHGLPIAVKTIAHTLKGQSRKHVWEDTLSCLKQYQDVNEVVHQIFEMSYNNLQDEETKSTLLLCSLFPGNSDTPTEDMVRYGWGLKLFNNVRTIIEARNRLNACIERLIHANFLIESQDVGCVKMHNLVRAFVLRMCSKGGHASIVGNMSKWPAKDTSESCKRISLTCTGMPEFPRDHKYPNLLLLKLMHGDSSLRFPEGLYEDMKKLQVIAYDVMECPLLLKSLQCSNLRTLCLHRCLLMSDCSSIGDLLSLEVLSFAHCSIEKLPGTIGNLKELKLLDLTGCVNLQIDDGVLKKLVKLEELYMRVAKRKAIKFTYANNDELVECSKNLLALEIEFFDNKSLPKTLSFKELERFKISLGCYLKENEGHTRHSFENTLMLVTNKCELLDSRMNELFEKTKVLHLQVNGINYIGDVIVESLHHPRSSFDNLRVLDVFECANLRYLFTVDVVNGLTKLERLTISFCPILETLVGGDSGRVEVIKFQALKFLSLGQLPKLMSLSDPVNVIKLPQLEELILYGLPNFTSIYANNKSTTSKVISPMQPLLNKKVVVSQLKILKIFHMKKLKEIWPSQLSNSEVVRFSTLREITIEGCDSLVNLFPSNPTALLHSLQELKIWNCGSVDVLFNIDLGSCVGEIEESCNLRYIQVTGLGNLTEIWRVKGVNNSNCLILGFQVVENIEIRGCKSFKNVFTPATINLEMRAPMKVTIDGIDGCGSDIEIVIRE